MGLIVDTAVPLQVRGTTSCAHEVLRNPGVSKPSGRLQHHTCLSRRTLQGYSMRLHMFPRRSHTQLHLQFHSSTLVSSKRSLAIASSDHS